MIGRQDLERELLEIAPFSASLMRLTDIILSGSYTIDDICNVIKLDQALTLDVIAYANSAESGSIKTIASVQEAIVRMGGSRIMRYLLAKWFRGSVAATIGSSADSLLFWKHGIHAAIASDVIADAVKELTHPAAFTTCLVHDVGWVPFAGWSMRFRHVFDWQLFRTEGQDKERKRFGYDHPEVGAMVLEKWRFPVDSINAVRFHSQLSGGPEILTDIIRLSNTVCHFLEAKEGSVEPLHMRELETKYRIKSAMLQEIVDSTRLVVAKTLEEFGVAT